MEKTVKRSDTEALDYYRECLAKGYRIDKGEVWYKDLYMRGAELAGLQEILVENRENVKLENSLTAEKKSFGGLIKKIREEADKTGKSIGRIYCDISMTSTGEPTAMRTYFFAGERFIEYCSGYKNKEEADLEAFPIAIRNLQTELLNYDITNFGNLVHITPIKKE